MVLSFFFELIHGANVLYTLLKKKSMLTLVQMNSGW